MNATDQRRRLRERHKPEPATTPARSDESWRDSAACAGEEVEMFFPERGSNIEVWNVRRWFCDVCPVKTPCGEYAIANRIDHGVWGGLTVGQRHLIRIERTTTKGQTR